MIGAQLIVHASDFAQFLSISETSTYFREATGETMY